MLFVTVQNSLEPRGRLKVEMQQCLFCVGIEMPGDPKECRERAQQCLKLAGSAPSLIAKMRFEGLAHSWLRLADDIERAAALLDHSGDTDLRKTG